MVHTDDPALPCEGVREHRPGGLVVPEGAKPDTAVHRPPEGLRMVIAVHPAAAAVGDLGQVVAGLRLADDPEVAAGVVEQILERGCFGDAGGVRQVGNRGVYVRGEGGV